MIPRKHDSEFLFVSSSGISLDSLDSEVISLIEDLGLVLKGSVEYLAWLTILENSCYSKYPFCARYKDYHKELKRKCADLARRNQKYSRFTYQSDPCVHTQSKLSVEML